MKISRTLEQGIRYIYPDTTLEESLKDMVLSEIKRKLLSFEVIDAQYKRKYKMEFEGFYKNKIEDKTPSFDEEEDYFNWEMAVTGIKELTKELKNWQKEKLFWKQYA